jgi:hypothetical protein
MPSLEALVNERVALKARRDAALAVVCERAGVAVPAIPDAGRPKPLAQYANFDLEPVAKPPLMSGPAAR